MCQPPTAVNHSLCALSTTLHIGLFKDAFLSFALFFPPQPTFVQPFLFQSAGSLDATFILYDVSKESLDEFQLTRPPCCVFFLQWTQSCCLVLVVLLFTFHGYYFQIVNRFSHWFDSTVTEYLLDRPLWASAEAFIVPRPSSWLWSLEIFLPRFTFLLQLKESLCDEFPTSFSVCNSETLTGAASLYDCCWLLKWPFLFLCNSCPVLRILCHFI